MRRKKRNVYAKNVRGGKPGNGKTGGWKRLLAMIITAVTLLTGTDLSGFESVFAEEKSGYKIDVSYSEGDIRATLTGNVQNVAEGVTLVNVSGPDGNQYDPSELSYPITENGDYVFTVDFQVSAGSEQVDKQEKITVTVDGIGGEETAAQSVSVTTPERMALSDLLAAAQSTSAKKTLTIVAEESRLELGTFDFEGGSFGEILTEPLSALLPNSPDVNKFATRYFKSGYFKMPAGNDEFPVTGLYEVGGQWYYTAGHEDGNTETSTGVSTDVAVLLPSEAEVYVSYAIGTDGTEYNITKEYSVGKGSEWNVVVGDSSFDATPERAHAYEQVVFSFAVPIELQSATVEVRGTASDSLYKTFDTTNPSGTGLTKTETSRETYSGMFYMPNEDVKLVFKGTGYGGNSQKYAGFVYPRIASENAETSRVPIAVPPYIEFPRKSDDVFRVYTVLDADNSNDGTNEMKVVYREDMGYHHPTQCQLQHSWNGSYMARLTPNSGNAATAGIYNTNVQVYDINDNLVSQHVPSNGKGTTPLKGNVANFTPGQTQKFTITYDAANIPTRSGTSGYSYFPVALDLYTYPNSNFGANPSVGSNNVLQETLALPVANKGDSKQYQTETGATIKITLTDKGKRPLAQMADPRNGSNTELTQRIARADAAFGTRNMGKVDNSRWYGGYSFNNFPNDMYFFNDWELSGRIAEQVPYYQYEITVSGMRYGYLLSFLDDAASQDIAQIVSMENVVEGDYSDITAGIVNMDTSTYKYLNGSSVTEDAVLGVGTTLWGSKTTANSTIPNYSGKVWELFLRPQMGHSRTRIDVENNNNFRAASVNTTDDNGRYRHEILAGNTGGNGVYSQIKISSKPITFNIQYQKSDGTPVGETSSLKPSTSLYYLVGLPSNLVNANEVLTGYEVIIQNNDDKVQYWDANTSSFVRGTKMTKVAKAKGSDGQYTADLSVQAQDLLNLEELYNFMLYEGGGLLLQDSDSAYTDSPDIEHEYTVILKAKTSTAPDAVGYTNIEYKVRRQQESFSTYTSNGQEVDTPDEMYSKDMGFLVDTRSKLAYQGTTVVVGSPEVLHAADIANNGAVNQNAHWVLSEYSTNSITVGDTAKLDVIYLLGAQVEYSNLNGNSGEKQITTDYYVSMDNHSKSVIDLSQVNPGTAPTGKVFGGWKITNTNASEYNSGANINNGAQLDLYELGKEAPTLWKDIFLTQGVLKLEAQWVDNTQPITLTEDETMSTINASVVDVYEGTDRKYSLSATFYMKGAVSESSTAQYYVYSKGASVDLWGSVERGVIDLHNKRPIQRINSGNNLHSTRFKDAQLSIATEPTAMGNTKITLTYSGIVGDQLGVTGINYRFYMWNAANSNQENTMGGRDYDSTEKLDAVFKPDTYPCNWQSVHVIPKVTTSYNSGIQITETPKSALFYEGSEFKVSGTFRLEGNAKETYDYLSSNNLLQIALYKKNPDGKTGGDKYAIWANKNGSLNSQDNKVGAPQITRVGPYEFTVSYTIKDYNSSITHDWDEGALYRIFAWTRSNGDVSGITDFGQDRSQFAWKTEINNIPSTTTAMTGVLGSQIEKIIIYPREITMSDDGDQHIYSGNKQITLNPFPTSAELPNPDPGVDVTIEQLTNSPTFNISRSNNDTIALQAFTGTRTSSGTDISTSRGKVGTMKFSTGAQPMQNTLPLYFKSKDTVTGFADGDPFIGHITFRFSKAASN